MACDIKTGKQLAQAALDVAKSYKTLYVLGCIGAPMTQPNKAVYLTKHCAAFNGRADRKVKIQAATADTFGFDCVCLIKSLLWGWDGDASQIYGGAVYKSNGVPDIDADFMIAACKDVSADFSNIQVGEALWIKGHIGIYVGGGKAVECTYRWKDGVQITAVHNIGSIDGYNGRTWTKHGKLPWISYAGSVPDVKATDYTIGLRNLRQGSRGDDVRALQQLLIANGCDCGVSGADGIYGAATCQAVKNYQKKFGDGNADGIVGIKTMTALLGVSA